MTGLCNYNIPRKGVVPISNQTLWEGKTKFKYNLNIDYFE